MGNITTGFFPTYVLNNDFSSMEEVSQIDRGENKTSRFTNFENDNSNNIDNFVDKLFKRIKNDDSLYSKSLIKENVSTKDSHSIEDVEDIKNFITTQVNTPIFEEAVNQQVNELRKSGSLRFYPLKPDVVLTKFELDANKNVIMLQKLQYNEYIECEPDGKEIKRHIGYDSDKPFVTVNCIFKFSPNGDVITNEAKLHIEFNRCGDDLNAIFDKRSLWTKICEFISSFIGKKNEFCFVSHDNLTPIGEDDNTDSDQIISNNDVESSNAPSDNIEIDIDKLLDCIDKDIARDEAEIEKINKDKEEFHRTDKLLENGDDMSVDLEEDDMSVDLEWDYSNLNLKI